MAAACAVDEDMLEVLDRAAVLEVLVLTTVDVVDFTTELEEVVEIVFVATELEVE